MVFFLFQMLSEKKIKVKKVFRHILYKIYKMIQNNTKNIDWIKKTTKQKCFVLYKYWKHVSKLQAQVNYALSEIELKNK